MLVVVVILVMVMMVVVVDIGDGSSISGDGGELQQLSGDLPFSHQHLTLPLLIISAEQRKNYKELRHHHRHHYLHHVQDHH